ncbi:MAG: hypothetical protein HYT40_01470 [Candidatus Sungbacteria bacterium]|uniref:Transcriptional repressor PaaX-like central Cas2-like domain-containing protein n=1 Tax=Candidatus Sungiibacteriota bacterium TaxID=2750080 RepID=A0A931WNZ6_9BACT|nr:hypothetical protein [Candidatus Sungbacteria bacterium]
MAKQEEKRPVISKVQREALQILREAGDLTLAFLLSAGSSARLWQSIGGKRKRERIRRSLAALERRGFIDMNKHGNETRVALSRDGKRIALAGNVEKISLPVIKYWDRKWRIILFDIPERLGNARRALSKRLRDMGAWQYQKSVFIYPFPCRDEIDFVTSFFNVREYVQYIEATSIDDAATLQKHFKLT